MWGVVCTRIVGALCHAIAISRGVLVGVTLGSHEHGAPMAVDVTYRAAAVSFSGGRRGDSDTSSSSGNKMAVTLDAVAAIEVAKVSAVSPTCSAAHQCSSRPDSLRRYPKHLLGGT